MSNREFPARWCFTTLGEIARDKPNNGIFRKNSEYLTNGSGGLPVVWVEELFRGNSIDTKNSRRVPATKAEIEKYGLKKGDVLFCRSSLKLDGIAFNNVYLGEDNAALFECHLIRISPKLENVSSIFLNWLLRSPPARAVAKSKSKTATMTTIDQQSLASIPIVLPPLAEQQRIADVLDKADTLRAKRCAALAQLDTLTQSIFLDMFGDPAANPKGWPTKSLASLVRKDDTINYGVVQPGDDVDNGVPLVRVGDLLDGRVSHASLKRIALSIEASYKRSRLRGDEILVSCVGSIGIVALTDESVKGFNIARAVARIPLAETTNRIFMAAYLKTDFVQHYFTNELRTVSQPTLNIKQLSETVVVLPPLNLQRDFAHRIAAVEKLN